MRSSGWQVEVGDVCVRGGINRGLWLWVWGHMQQGTRTRVDRQADKDCKLKEGEGRRSYRINLGPHLLIACIALESPLQHTPLRFVLLNFTDH